MKMKINREVFIGMLSDEEATEWRKKNDEWSEKFNNDFKRKKIELDKLNEDINPLTR